MKIKNITIKDFKGLTIATPLFPVTLITGQNGSGKTSILDAIEILTTGRLTSVSPKENTQTASKMRRLGPANGYLLEATIESDAEHSHDLIYRVMDPDDGIIWDPVPEIPPINLRQPLEFLNLSGPARVREVLAAAHARRHAKEFEGMVSASQITDLQDGAFPDRVQAFIDLITVAGRGLAEKVKNAKGYEPDCSRPSLDEVAAADKHAVDLNDLVAAARERQQFNQHRRLIASQSDGLTLGDIKKLHGLVETLGRSLIGLGQEKSRLEAAKMGRQRAHSEFSNQLMTAANASTTCPHCGALPEHQAQPLTEAEAMAARQALKAKMAETEKLIAQSVQQIKDVTDESNLIKAERQALMDQLAKNSALAGELPDPTHARCQLLQHAGDLDRVEDMKAMATAIDSDPNHLALIVKDAATAMQTASELRRAVEEWEDYEARQVAIAEAEPKLKQLRATLKQAKEFQKRMAAEIFQRLLALGNELVTGYQFEWIKDTVQLVRSGRPPMIYESMSGAEQHAARLCIALGFQQANGSRLAVLDEASVFHPAAQARALQTLKEAVEAGKLDQVIICKPTDDPLTISEL